MSARLAVSNLLPPSIVEVRSVGGLNRTPICLNGKTIYPCRTTYIHILSLPFFLLIPISHLHQIIISATSTYLRQTFHSPTSRSHISQFPMGFHYTGALEKHDVVGIGLHAYIYHVTPAIVVKTVHRDGNPEEAAEHPFTKEIAFYKRLNEREDRCSSIIDCSLILPNHLFLSYCPHRTIALRLYDRQEREGREEGSNRLRGRLIRVKEYEAPACIARCIQQITSALEYVEKMGFCHNDLHAGNCLLDQDFNVKLTDFGRATTIGQFLEGTMPPRARPILAGPLKGSYGLCSARTEQFAIGTVLYLIVYGHEPYDDIDDLSPVEWDRRFWELEFPDLNRHEVFDGLISGC